MTATKAYVYELVWPNTNEIYIGSTSRTPEERFKGHKKQPHKCYEHLGIENARIGRCFSYVPKHNRDRDAEAQHKKEMQARGYTVLDDGDKHCTPLQQSEEAKRKLSKSHLGKKLSKDHKWHISEAVNRPERIRRQREARGHHFTCTWPDGRVKHYLSAPQAEADLGVSRVTITRYLKGLRTPGSRKESAHLCGCIFEYC